MLPNRGWATTISAAEQLEALGFDMVAVDDHLTNPMQPERPWAEVWTTLAAIAARTSTIRLAPVVANTVLRHPAVLARQALTVDDISGGRLDIGLGAGYAPTDLRGVGVDRLAPEPWAARFGEAVATIAALLAGTPAPAGRYFDASETVLRSPAATPELTIAAHSRSSLDVVARHGARWISYGGWGLSMDALVALTRQRLDHLHDRWQAHGRPGRPGVSLLLGSAAVCAEPLWTSAEAFEDTIGRFVDIGVDTFVVYWPPSSVSPHVDPDAQERIVSEVIPRLRASSA